MKLITENIESIDVITEGSGKSKSLHIEGVFLQSETKNKNGRVYPKEILEKEVERYNNQYIKTNRAFGELGHPEGPTINLERVSHLVTELKPQGNNFVGKAKIMTSTPYGKIVESLLDEGAQLGVSSRGMGTLKQDKNGTNVVQDDFYLATAADIVADPSAPKAFVEGIMEGREWVWESGILKEKEIELLKNELDKKKSIREELVLSAFESFISKL
tara:strand:- start:190 stop:837 length:648 start_codon:yes stop_codon:yes gene_type:complete